MNVDVATRGEVTAEELLAARARVSAIEDAISTPVLRCRVVLTMEPNPRIPRPARAEGELDLQGVPVHARVSAETMQQAVRELAERLEAQAQRFTGRMRTLGHRPVEAPAGEWFHGAWSRPRPPRFPRPAAERQIVRRKSFSLGSQTEEQAAADLAALDHDFLLFRDADTGADAVLYCRDDGRLGLIEPPGTEPPGTEPPDAEGPVRETSRISEPIDLATAVAEMNELGHRFLFFVDAASGQGTVIYLRYDGHYGLIHPA